MAQLSIWGGYDRLIVNWSRKRTGKEIRDRVCRFTTDLIQIVQDRSVSFQFTPAATFWVVSFTRWELYELHGAAKMRSAFRLLENGFAV